MAHLRSLASAMFLMLVPITLASCARNQQQSQPGNRAADEFTIRTIDTIWVKAIAGKDARQTASYYLDGGSLLAPGAPLASGTVQKTWALRLGFALHARRKRRSHRPHRPA